MLSIYLIFTTTFLWFTLASIIQLIRAGAFPKRIQPYLAFIIVSSMALLGTVLSLRSMLHLLPS